LAESEERYRTVFENTGTATIIIEEDKTISMVNIQSEKMYGYSKEEIENKVKWTDFVIPEDLERMKKYHIARRKTGEKAPTEYEFCLIDKKGNIKDILLKIGMIPNTKKSVASLMDITERKQAEDRAKYLNLILRAIRSVNQLIVKEKDRERLLQGVCNNLIETGGCYSAWVALLDESGKLETYAEAGIGKAILPMVEILKKGEPVVCGQKALKQRKVVIIKDPASTCTGCPLVKQHSGQRVLTTRLEYNGKVYGFVSVSAPAHITVGKEEQSLFKEVAEDIAFAIHNIKLDKERKQAEENVKKIKDELGMLLDSVPAIIFYKDTEGRIIRANKAFTDALKMPMKDIVGKTTEEIVPKEQAEKMRKTDREVIISGKPKRNIIQTYNTPEGTRWAITDKIPHKDKEGKIAGIVSLSKDITVQKKTEQRLKKTMDAAIDTMSKIIEAKDPYTSGHQHRVCQLAVPLARELGLSEDKIEGVRIASLIHDIGKIGLPTEILSKPTKLTDIESSLIKGHSQIGYDILKSIEFSYPIARIVLQHHERLNGSGYPNHLKGDKILLEARILGVADVVEAMSSHRPYRPALGIDKALEEITQNKGILYDPEVVDVCLKLFKEKGFKFE
jgi:PAS domain S-box-containing protein